MEEQYCPSCGSPIHFDKDRIGTCTYSDCRKKWSYMQFPNDIIMLYPMDELVLEFLKRAMDAPRWATAQYITGNQSTSINWSSYSFGPYSSITR